MIYINNQCFWDSNATDDEYREYEVTLSGGAATVDFVYGGNSDIKGLRRCIALLQGTGHTLRLIAMPSDKKYGKSRYDRIVELINNSDCFKTVSILDPVNLRSCQAIDNLQCIDLGGTLTRIRGASSYNPTAICFVSMRQEEKYKKLGLTVDCCQLNGMPNRFIYCNGDFSMLPKNCKGLTVLLYVDTIFSGRNLATIIEALRDEGVAKVVVYATRLYTDDLDSLGADEVITSWSSKYQQDAFDEDFTEDIEEDDDDYDSENETPLKCINLDYFVDLVIDRNADDKDEVDE